MSSELRIEPPLEERRNPTLSSEDALEKVAELQRDVARIEFPLQSLFHDTKQATTGFQFADLLSDVQEDNLVKEIVPKIAAKAKAIRNTIEKTFAIVKPKVKTAGLEIE